MSLNSSKLSTLADKIDEREVVVVKKAKKEVEKVEVKKK